MPHFFLARPLRNGAKNAEAGDARGMCLYAQMLENGLGVKKETRSSRGNGTAGPRRQDSPKAIDRMTSYVYQAKPRTEEMLVDEMLAICEEINTWREKKASQEAQEKYNAYLFGRR